jgi:hypothetical protein
VATKPTKKRGAPPRKKRKTLANGRPKRHRWTRKDGEIHPAGFKIGYARVSTLDQNLALQEDALKEAGAQQFTSSRCRARSQTGLRFLRRSITPAAATRS